MPGKQLECRIVITRHPDKRVELGMYCPVTYRYQKTGVHGPDLREIDKAVLNLKSSIEKAGHRLTFCERTEE